MISDSKICRITWLGILSHELEIFKFISSFLIAFIPLFLTSCMPGIDRLISKYLANEFKRQLKTSILKKIEKDLFFIHGMSIKLSIENFKTLHDQLRSFPELEPKNLEKTCIEKIIQITKTNNDYSIKIINSKLLTKIFDYLGDPESRKLISSMMSIELTIPEILAETKILKSPAYRKIENMLLDGLIVESGKILSNKKRVSRYRCIFKEIKLTVGKNNFEIDILMNKKELESSSVFKFGYLENQ